MFVRFLTSEKTGFEEDFSKDEPNFNGPYFPYPFQFHLMHTATGYSTLFQRN